MKGDRLDIFIGIESVIIEVNCTTYVMGHVEAMREMLVVNVVTRLLQGNHIAFSCNLSSEGIFFSPTGSTVPVDGTGRKAFIGTVHVWGGSVFSFICLAKLCCSFSVSTICWTRISFSLCLAHEVNRSVLEKSISSRPLRFHQRRSRLSHPEACANMVAMVPHQHFWIPEKKECTTERAWLHVSFFQKLKHLEQGVLEVWLYAGDPSEQENDKGFLVRIRVTMAPSLMQRLCAIMIETVLMNNSILDRARAGDRSKISLVTDIKTRSSFNIMVNPTSGNVVAWSTT